MGGLRGRKIDVGVISIKIVYEAVGNYPLTQVGDVDRK